MTRQGATAYYTRAIEAQEKHCPEFRDTQAARAVLDATPPTDHPTVRLTNPKGRRMTKHTISIEIDEAELPRYTNTHLAMIWHVAQANPRDGFADSIAGDLAERIGREIIRRWLKATPPELWHHQGRHNPGAQLSKFAKYTPPADAEMGSPEWHAGTWTLRDDIKEDAR